MTSRRVLIGVATAFALNIAANMVATYLSDRIKAQK